MIQVLKRQADFSRAEYPRVPSTDHRGNFFSFVCISRLFLPHFSERHDIQTLEIDRLSNTHGPICCLYNLSATEFPLSTSQLPNVKHFFSSEIACSQTSSPPPAMSLLATQGYHGIFVVRHLWLSRGNHSSILLCHQPAHWPSWGNCTQTSRDSPGIPSGGILTKSGCPLLIRSPVLNACCASPNCNLCPWLHRDCKTVIKPSRVSAGECDSMLGRSGSVKPLMISRAFAWRPDVLLSSGFQVRTQRVPIARSGQHARAWTVSSGDSTLAAWLLSRACHSICMLFRNSRFSAGDKWLIFTSLALSHLVPKRDAEECFFRDPAPTAFSTHSVGSSGNATSTAISSSLVSESKCTGSMLRLRLEQL